MAPIVAGRWWTLKVAVTTAIVSFVCQSPAIQIKRTLFATIVEQGNHPLTPLKVSDPALHEAKLAFRLIPPLLVHYGHLSAGSYLVFQGALGVATLAALAGLFHRMGYSRRVAFALVFALAFTYVGSVWFVDAQPYFDALAASALVVSMCVSNPVLVFLAGSIALWTDERSILAIGVVVLFHLRRRERAAVNAAAIALALYVLVRLYLGHRYGLSTGKSEIGPSVFFHLWKTTPIALVLSLEGLWALVAVGLAGPMRDRDWMAWAVAILTIGSTMTAAMVDDVTRSTVYLLPAVLMSLSFLVERPEAERTRLIGVVTLICVLVVTTPVILARFGPLYPLPVRLIF